MTARHEKLQFAKPQLPREVVREAVEENTGEKFKFTEKLNVYADFVPDLKPADADALNDSGNAGSLVLMATDGATRFARVGGQFLGQPLTAQDVQLVDL